MVWTVSQTATTLTITPDGTSSENLSTVLDLAISTLGVNAGVTKPSLYTYESTKKILIAADVSTNYLYVSGLNLTLRDQFIRAANSRVRFGNVNAAGAVVGKASIIISNQPNSNYGYINAPFTVSGINALIEATDLTLIFRRTTSIDGSMIYGFDVSGLSIGSVANCSFQSDSNGGTSDAIFFFSGEDYSNCVFTGFPVCEIAFAGRLLKNCTFTTVPILKNSFSGNYYLEGIAAPKLIVQRGGSTLLTDSLISVLETNNPNNLNASSAITLRNSIQLLGGVSEASGFFVIRLSSNVQVYKRTFNASGLIAGGNSIGATDGVSSSSDRLLIPVQKYGVSGTAQITVFDYRGVWEGVFVKYGRLPTVFSFNLQGTTATLQNVPFASLPDTGITVSNPATVAAYTTIAINHSTSTVTISGATTQRQLHDYCALEKASFADSGLTVGGNPVPKACLPTIGSSIYNRPVGAFLYNLSLASGATLTGIDSVSLAAGKNVTLVSTGTYTTSPIEVSSTSAILLGTATAEALTFDLRGWLLANGSAINLINTTTGTAIVTVDASQLANITAGARVTIQLPLVFVSALNFAQNTRVQVARLEPYSVPSTAINTTTGIITIAGNRFKSASPATLVYFQLGSGATIPTTTPQITNNTLYFVQSAGVADGLTAGQFKLSLTQSGTAISFSTQGTGNFTLTGITELDNSLAGAGGYSVALTEPNNTLLRISAQPWQNATGCTAGNFYQQNIIWNSTSGNAIADTVSISANPDTIHNFLIGNSTRVFNTNVTLPSDGSTISGISFNAQGVISLDPRSFASVAGFPTLTPQAAYLYTVFYRSTATGIRVIGNQFSAQDSANFTFSGLKLDNIADGIRNTPNTPAMIAGGYVATIDGSNPILPISGAIYLNADRRGVLVTTTAGSTIAPTQQQIRDALTLSTVQSPVTGSIDSKLALIPTTDNAANVTAIKTQTDKLVFTTANRVDSTAIGVPTNPLITTDTRLNNLDATISSRLASAGYATPPNVAAITTAVWTNTVRELTSGANIVLAKGAGITGLNDITAQSVLSVATSSQITAGTIGKLFADNINAPISAIPTNPLLATDGRINNLDATISSRSTQSSVNAIPINPLLTTDGRLNFIDASIAANSPANVWNFTTRTLTSAGSTLTAADVWSYTTRSLTTPFPSVPSSTDNAIAIRTNLAIELARVDASIASRSSGSAIVAIDGKLDEIKTNTAGGDYVVL